MTGSVATIHIAEKEGAPLAELTSAELLPGRGISGDRHCSVLDPSNEGQVSLVEAEGVEAFARDIGFPLQPQETRRNIVTREVSLNELVGMRFAVGEAELLGTELCEPCAYLAKTLIERFALSDVAPKDIVAGLAHRAGIRAKILRGGTVRPGDRIVPLPAEESSGEPAGEHGDDPQ